MDIQNGQASIAPFIKAEPRLSIAGSVHPWADLKLSLDNSVNATCSSSGKSLTISTDLRLVGDGYLEMGWEFKVLGKKFDLDHEFSLGRFLNWSNNLWTKTWH